MARKQRVSKGRSAPRDKTRTLRKTSVYLDESLSRRLQQIAERSGRPQSEIIREAIASYEPPAGGDRNFALAGGFERTDADRRPISEIPEAELLRGFGE